LDFEFIFKNSIKHDGNIQKSFSRPSQEGINESVEVKLRSFLTSALDAGKYSTSRSSRFIAYIHSILVWTFLINKAN